MLLPGEGCWQIYRKEIRKKKLEGHKWIISSQEMMPTISSLWKSTSVPKWQGSYTGNVYSLLKEYTRSESFLSFQGCLKHLGIRIWMYVFSIEGDLFLQRDLNFTLEGNIFWYLNSCLRFKIPTLCFCHLMVFINS